MLFMSFWASIAPSGQQPQSQPLPYVLIMPRTCHLFQLNLCMSCGSDFCPLKQTRKSFKWLKSRFLAILAIFEPEVRSFGIANRQNKVAFVF